MSDRIKYGETYESLAQNIEPYLNLNNPRVTVTYSPSIYPIWWDKTITIYNKYEDPITQYVKWYKNILDNCFLQSAKTQISSGQITYNTDTNIVRIPENNNFKDYAEWINIPNTEQGNYFTLHQGDIIIKGEVEDVIDEYTNGKRSTDLISKYKELGMCLTIDNWQNNTGVGRGCPHYFVSGE